MICKSVKLRLQNKNIITNFVMSELLGPEELIALLFSDIDKTKPCIVYMGVGTHCNVSPLWNHELNQQMPIFLHDWKINNSDIPVKIILFDGLANSDPYIVTDTNAYYSDSFIKSPKYSNVYTSDFGLQVYSFALNVKWVNDKFNMGGSYDVTNLVGNIIKKVSDSNFLFFFHEFTGRNPEMLEYQMKQMIDYDETKICIDISRGRDLSCCVNFLEPENYPLIVQNEKIISWLNPKLVSFEKRQLLINKFTNKSFIVTNCPYNDSEAFDYFLFKQIKNVSQYIYNLSCQLIHTIRTLYNRDTRFTKYDEDCIINLDILIIKINNFSIVYNDIISRMLLLKEIIKITHDANVIYPYKINLLENLKNVIELCLTNIKLIPKNEYNKLFIIFDTLEDKYKLMGIFRDFCLKHQFMF